jgi:hypothetical protein
MDDKTKNLVTKPRICAQIDKAPISASPLPAINQGVSVTEHANPAERAPQSRCSVFSMQTLTIGCFTEYKTPWAQVLQGRLT